MVLMSLQTPQKLLQLPDAWEAEKSKEAQQDSDVWVLLGAPSRTDLPETSSAKKRSQESWVEQQRRGHSHALIFPKGRSILHTVKVSRFQSCSKASFAPDVLHRGQVKGASRCLPPSLGGFLGRVGA